MSRFNISFYDRLSGSQRCVLCGRATAKENVLAEEIGGVTYVFDKDECVMMFKRFRRTYGPNFIQEFENS